MQKIIGVTELQRRFRLEDFCVGMVDTAGDCSGCHSEAQLRNPWIVAQETVLVCEVESDSYVQAQDKPSLAFRMTI